jgi:hypothetical protein
MHGVMSAPVRSRTHVSACAAGPAKRLYCCPIGGAPRSSRPSRDLARLLRRLARRHDHALCRQPRRRPSVAMALRPLSGIRARRMQERYGGEFRGGRDPHSRRPGARSYRNGLRQIFRNGRISAIGPPRDTGASIAASACRMIGGRVPDRWLAPGNLDRLG